MTDRLTTLLEGLAGSESLDTGQRADLARRCQWVREATAEEIGDLLTGLRQLPASPAPEVQQPLTAVLGHLGVRLRAMAGPSTERGFWDGLRSEVAPLYRQLGPNSTGRHHLLAVLAGSEAAEDLEEFAELLVSDPPPNGDLAVLALTPLFQNTSDARSCLFPRLLDGLEHPSVAAPILDLANYLTRQQVLAEHPGADRTPQLATLLGQLVERLHMLEQQALGDESSSEQLSANQRQVAESLALTVSLCHALALVGDTTVVGKLFQAMELGHRHVRTEAASALARLGESDGKKILAALAAEPVVRLRVLAYAEELDMLDEVATEYRSPVARAESEFVLWLADPAQFGMPPQQLDLLDSRRQFWPGYDEPVDCYLFRYTYHLPQGSLSNVGIAGPLVLGFAADFTDVPVADVYAAFAGWQTEHPEIVEYAVDELPSERRSEAETIEARIRTEGYDSLQVRQFSLFLDKLVVIATAVHGENFGSVVADGAQSFWCPQAQGASPLGPDDAYNIYKGRVFLQTFNRGSDE